MNFKSIEFESLENAVAYAQKEGGWIFNGSNKVLWFNAQFYTPSTILETVTGSGTLGTWARFN